MTHHSRNSKANARGSALLIALAILSFVTVMGVAMYGYMAVESDRQSGDTNAARAAWVARSGVESAIADIQAGIPTGQAPAASQSIDVPVYKQMNAEGRVTDPASQAPEADSDFTSVANVSVSDESAKINVNLAPPAVLMSILKIDGDKARQIREKLPRIDDTPAPAGDAARHWLTSVDDLVSRQLLTSESLTAERAADLTVYTGADPQNAAGLINLNTASSAVLEAALGVTPDVAAKIIAARPLSSLDALKAAAGKEPSGFNFKPAADNPGALPKELGFASRCYRLVSRAEVARTGESASIPVASATVEAVVQFPENAAPRIVYWNESAAAKSSK